jgi:UDP-2,3-diacylglucosamine pyrophosphatase LpxH
VRSVVYGALSGHAKDNDSRMALLDGVRIPSLPLDVSELLVGLWRRIAHGRIDGVFATAPRLSYDERSRIIFFSDSHRGDNSRADVFRPNEPLFLRVLEHYYDRGYTYVEVGDGDELWQNRHFGDVYRAHPRTFDLLHRFHDQARLHLILGNHDIQGRQKGLVRKGILTAYEGLVLEHARSRQRILAVHGHQADLPADRMQMISRFAVRRVWRRMVDMGLAGKHVEAALIKSPDERGPMGVVMRSLRRHFEERLVEWAAITRHVLICGHTHRAQGASYGAPPYFNTGSCMQPGQMTGLEVCGGEIVQVRWLARPGANRNGLPRVERQEMAAPQLLRRLA